MSKRRNLKRANAKKLLDNAALILLNGICASGPGSHMSDERLAKEAYNLARALMAERSKQ